MRIINMMVLVAGAAIVASCSDSTKMNHEVRQTAQSERIGFVTYSEKTTRADETNSVNLYDFYKTFDVYAWKNANSQVQSVFNHIPVEYFTEDTVGTYVYKQSPAKPSIEWGDDWKTANNRKGWFYEEVRYWDKLATSYNFYAIAPYEVNPSPAIHIEDGQDNITIGSDSARYKVSTEKNLALVNDTITMGRKYYGFNKDYMLADKSETKYNIVTLTFHHILTKLNVKITLTDAYKGAQPFIIRDLKIAGLEDEAYFDYTTSMTTNGWSTKSDLTYDLHIDTDYFLKNVPDSIADTTQYSGYYWIQTLIFPQTLKCDTIGAQTTAQNSKYLYIEYAIGEEIFNAYYDLAYVFGSTMEASNNTYELKQGSEYTININVGPDPITFEAKASKWDDDTEIDHNIN